MELKEIKILLTQQKEEKITGYQISCLTEDQIRCLTGYQISWLTERIEEIEKNL